MARARLEAIDAAESECCSFLDFQLRATGDELNLSITAPEGAEAIADDLRRAFAEGAPGQTVGLTPPPASLPKQPS